MMKTTTYKTEDGAVFCAVSAADLVRQLHEISMAPAEDDETWMAQTAARTQEQTGRPVRHDNAEEFVADLLKLGLIKSRLA